MQELIALVSGDVGENAAIALALEEPVGPGVVVERVCTALPIAPAATSWLARSVDRVSKRSEKHTDQMRPVSCWTRFTSASCSSDTTPGLSTITSLPERIASIAVAARSSGIEAVTIIRIDGSSRMARLSETRFAWGNALQ